jgi:LacI family transcriptional regulator
LNVVVRAEDHLTDSCVDWTNWSGQLADKLKRSRCTAILCAIDYELQPIMFYLQSQGKGVPSDYSVICLETLSHAVITHVARPHLQVRECGRRAAERLLWRIANPDAPFEHIRVTGGFINGETTARLP